MDISSIKNIKISDNENLFLEAKNMTPYLMNISQEMYGDVLKGKRGVFDKLFKYIKKYPNVPVFKNYLAVAYESSNKPEKAYEINRRIVEEHPEYLFGKIKLADEYIDKEAFEKALYVLGETLDLQDLYPDKLLFHVDEVVTYYIIVVKYLFAVEDEEQAELLIETLHDIFSGHHKLGAIAKMRMQYSIKQVQKRIAEENELRKSVDPLDRRTQFQTTEPPEFNFPDQIGKLYKTDMTIGDEEIDELLALPIDTLEEDLIKVLKDSIYRFEYFEEIANQEEWDEESFSFPSHALVLLLEAKGKKTLPVVLELLRQDKDYVSLWFEDALPDLISPILYHLGKNDLDTLLDFAKESNILCYNKSIVISVVNQLHFYEPNRSEEIIAWFKELLAFLIKNNDDPTLGDSDLLGLLIADVVHTKPKELLPQIKTLFDMEAVGLWICGNYEDIIKRIDFEEELDEKYKDGLLTLNSSKALYKSYYDRWLQEYEEMETENMLENHEAYDDYSVYDDNYDNQPVMKEKKTGRNEPCPCGSGKKYKKCCINL